MSDASGPLAGLTAVVEELRRRTRASRTTVRRCLPDDAELLAEALADGVPSMGTRAVAGVVEAPTYRFLAERHEILVQDDVVASPVAPPASLVERYDVRAQMLAPVIVGDEMVATVSVHEQGRTRDWAEDDVAALRWAQAEVAARLGPDEAVRRGARGAGAV